MHHEIVGLRRQVQAMRIAGLLLVAAVGISVMLGLQSAATPAAPVTGTKEPVRFGPTPLPTDEGIPVNQWYMNTTDADGAKLTHYIAEYGVESKPGNTVIVLHGGWGAEHSYLVPAIKPLADEYRFVLYDQRGSLRSPATPPAKITYANLIEDLDQLRQRLGLEKVTLMAHSMGNMLAYGYLRAHPERVAGLILVGPVFPGHDNGTDEAPRMVPPCVNEVWPDFSKADGDAMADRMKKWRRDCNDRWPRIAVAEGLIPADWVAQNAADPDPDLNALYIKTDQQRTMSWRIMFTAVNTYSGRNWRENLGGMAFYNPAVAESIFAEPDYLSQVDAAWPALKAFTGPVRVIIGTHDYVDLGPTFWPRLVAAMPNARLDTIQNAGHSIWMDEPERFAQSLRSALEATVAGTPGKSAEAALAAVVAWVRAHAVPLAGADPALLEGDLDALAPILGEARVVGVGEGTHGTREFFQFRDRLVRWLAARGRLDAVLWETALAPTLAREWLLTDREAPYAFESVFSGGLWNTEENRALVDALRAHNLGAARPVRFLGADISDLNVSLTIAAEAARRVGGAAAAPYAVIADVLGRDPGELCRDAQACEGAVFTLPAAELRRFVEAVDWLADELEAAGEPWTVTIASRAPADLGRQYLPFLLMPGAPADAPVGLTDGWARDARAAARAAADTLAAVVGAQDPGYWAAVGPVVAAVPDGADAYRDSMSRSERFEWDHALRGLRARVATGRYGGDPALVGAADALVVWLDAVHESLRRSPTHMEFDNYREVAMGRNLAEMGRKIEGDGYVVYAGHNGHVGYNPSITLARRSSGAYARDGLGAGYLAVGTFFGSGSFQAFDRSWRHGSGAPQWRAFESAPAEGSFEAMLAATGLDAFALDLRRLPPSGLVADWFAEARPTRSIGNSFTPDGPSEGIEAEYQAEVVADGFDVVVFFREASRAVPTAAERERGSYDP